MSTPMRCAYVKPGYEGEFTVGKVYLSTGPDGKGFVLGNDGGSWSTSKEGFEVYAFLGDLIATFEDADAETLQPTKAMIEAGIKELEMIFSPRELDDFDEDALSDAVVFIWQAMASARNKENK